MARTVKKATILTPEEKLAQAFVPVAEQPYQVPKNWCWIRLDALKVDANGFFDGDWILSENMDSAGEVRLLQLSDIGIGEFIDKSDKHISEKTYRQLGCTPLHEGDVMISRMAEPIARSCIVPSFPYTVITAVDVAVIRCNPSIVINCYLNYLCNAKWFTDLAFSLARGTTRVRITRKNLGDMPVPIPPLAEQQRIVDSIGSLFAKLDEAKEKAQAVVDGFEDRKAAILHKAFSGKLTGEWRKTGGKSISEWKTVTVGDISDVKGGKRVPKGMSLTDINTGHPYIKAGNLKQGTVIDNGISYVPDEVLPFIKNYTVNTGDVYITNVGACIGDCGVIPSQFDGANLTENAVKMTNLQCLSEYLAYYLSSSNVQQLIKTLIASATLGKLSIANIKTIPVFLPSDEEQRKIIGVISQLFEKELQAKEAAEQVLDRIDTMKKSILARAFRGELGTNDPADESAEELLKRIM